MPNTQSRLTWNQAPSGYLCMQNRLNISSGRSDSRPWSTAGLPRDAQPAENGASSVTKLTRPAKTAPAETLPAQDSHLKSDLER
jgi:hypothetical protein